MRRDRSKIGEAEMDVVMWKEQSEESQGSSVSLLCSVTGWRQPWKTWSQDRVRRGFQVTGLRTPMWPC